MAMTYATAEAVLAKMFGIPDDVKGAAFRARLRHLQKLGIPFGARPGTGRKIWYSEEQVQQWAFCLELVECGLEPSAVVKLIAENWTEIAAQFATALARSAPDEICFYMEPRSMSVAISGAPLEFKLKTVSAVRLHGTRRALIVNLSAMANEMAILRTMADSTIDHKKDDDNAR